MMQSLHAPAPFSVSMHPGRSAHAMAVAGALCELFNQASEVQLAFLLRSIETGDAPAAARAAQGILGAIASSATGCEPRVLVTPLSSRELKVLCMIASGSTNRQIADATHRSINTIEAQVKSMYRKLGVRSRTQAVREAMQRGLLMWRDEGVPVAVIRADVSAAC